jgi:hypothetical protein
LSLTFAFVASKGILKVPVPALYEGFTVSSSGSPVLESEKLPFSK